MNKVAIVIIALGIVLLGGFLYLTTRPQPEPVEIPDSTPTETISEDNVQGLNTQNQQETMDTAQYPSPPEMTIDQAKTYTATIKTNKGPMTLQLFADETPIAVNNFVFLANEGFYDNTPFHRIISGFMIQGGDPKGNGTGGPGYQFDDEPITRDYTRGTLAMANAGPNTNGSQFFIMHADYDLPKNYVIFGHITDNSSYATLDAIASTPVEPNNFGEQSSPTEQVLIESIIIEAK